MNTEEIPLFPLNTVLFPGMPLQLHIFEDRYKEMIQKCLTQELDFGVILHQDSKLSDVGCTAKIKQIIRQYDNGESEILTEGQRRFRIRKILRKEVFLEASVEYFDDDNEDLPAEFLQKVVSTYQKLISLQTRGVGSIRGIFDPVNFSFIIASTLDIIPQERQILLELTSTYERIKRLETALLKSMDELNKEEEIRNLASQNGHSKNKANGIEPTQGT